MLRRRENEEDSEVTLGLMYELLQWQLTKPDRRVGSEIR